MLIFSRAMEQIDCTGLIDDHRTASGSGPHPRIDTQQQRTPSAALQTHASNAV